MVLDAIIRHKREEIFRRKKHNPLDGIKSGLSPSTRSLKKALQKRQTGFILELKKASPSRGIIRRDFDPAALAKIYEPYADGISVLADQRFFEGRIEFVRDVSSVVELPVLLKDFVIDSYQVFEARKYGADAILLMLTVLNDNDFVECLETARQLGMDALVEVHDEEELVRALDLGAEIVGINNRDLKNLEVDLRTTEKLAPLVPKDRIVVAESGIRDHLDIVRLREMVSGFLVGSTLMARADLDRAVRELIFGSVKVCGLTRPKDALCARKVGAVYGGLIFAEESPRRVEMKTAGRLAADISLDWAGVFLNEEIDHVVKAARELDLRVVQLHGEEDENYLRKLKTVIGETCEIWKAIRVKDHIPNIGDTNADRVLLDTFKPFVPGGTGTRFDWSLLEGLSKKDIVLSGGLNPDNAEDADKIGAGVIDVNSGLEQSPGIKDHELIKSFFEELRGPTRS